MRDRKCIICEKPIGTEDKRRKACLHQCSEKLRVRTKVKSELNRSLGFEPPDDLIEEATALRLLNRAIRGG